MISKAISTASPSAAALPARAGCPPSFRLEEHGLKKLRVDTFGDLVFGTLSPEAPPWRATSAT